MKKKIVKIIAASGLAVMMGVGVLCGTIIPMSGSAASSMTSQSSQSGLAAGHNDSGSATAAQLGDSALTPQEKLFAGTGLGLDPENDPVVFTTDWGLEIKYANALTNTNLAGYTYFTMGKYNGYDVNWVIIGYDSSMADFVGDFLGQTGQSANPVQGENHQYSTLDDTPAGLAIKKETIAISSQAIEDDEIGDGCVLCLSECVLFKTQFYTSSQTPIYEGSNLQSVFQNLPITLGFDDSRIVSRTITTRYNTSRDSSFREVDSEDQKFFTSVVRDGNQFWSITKYLASNSIAIAYEIGTNTPTSYWIREGVYGTGYNSNACYVNASGASVADGGANVTSSLGVRPSFVLNLFA